MVLNVENEDSVENSANSFGDIPPWVLRFKGCAIGLLVNIYKPRMRYDIHGHYLYSLVSKCGLSNDTQYSEEIIKCRVPRFKFSSGKETRIFPVLWIISLASLLIN